MSDDKEWKRRSHALSKHGVKIVREPQKNIVLCNAGLATGLRERELFETFSGFGHIENYRLLPGKSYSFITYSNVESAVDARDRVHGTKGLCQNGHASFLAFVESIPQKEDQEDNRRPDGLILLSDVISPEEEKLFVNGIDWEEDGSVGSEMKNRRVQHYGYEFIYGLNNIDADKPLVDRPVPSFCDFLWEKLKKEGYDYPFPPDQLTVNQYSPGQGIPSHVDTHSAFLSPIISLSLENSIVMDFKNTSSDGKNRYFHLRLPPRSLLIMDGESRYDWSHGIVPRNYDIVHGKYCERSRRTSFTFRWIRRDKQCDCSFTKNCDTYQKKKSQIGNLASIVEFNHVHKVYEEIASHFSDTRTKIWPSVRNFIDSLIPGTILFDIGCGNGKNLLIRNDVISIGLEYSDGLAKLASKRSKEDSEDLNKIMRGDCLYLPIKSDCADAVMSIAVFHHLATTERRLRAIGELIRILRIGGRGLISVWAKNQNRNNEKTSYLKQDRKNRKQTSNVAESVDNSTEVLKDDAGQSLNIVLPVHRNRTDFAHQDMLVPWKKVSNDAENGQSTDEMETFMRFYHVFEENELENLCRTFAGVEIENSFYEQGNWCVVFKKVCQS